MDDRNPAEELPELYRSVLDVLAKLDRAGERRAAYELRRRATRIYATRWNDGGRRALQKTLRDAEHQLASSSRAAALGPVGLSA